MHVLIAKDWQSWSWIEQGCACSEWQRRKKRLLCSGMVESKSEWKLFVMLNKYLIVSEEICKKSQWRPIYRGSAGYWKGKKERGNDNKHSRGPRLAQGCAFWIGIRFCMAGMPRAELQISTRWCMCMCTWCTYKYANLKQWIQFVSERRWLIKGVFSRMV